MGHGNDEGRKTLDEALQDKAERLRSTMLQVAYLAVEYQLDFGSQDGTHSRLESRE